MLPYIIYYDRTLSRNVNLLTLFLLKLLGCFSLQFSPTELLRTVSVDTPSVSLSTRNKGVGGHLTFVISEQHVA